MALRKCKGVQRTKAQGGGLPEAARCARRPARRMAMSRGLPSGALAACLWHDTWCRQFPSVPITGETTFAAAQGCDGPICCVLTTLQRGPT